MTFRSLEMKHYQMIVPVDLGYSLVETLLSFGKVHLSDACPVTAKGYYPQLKRCEDIASKIRSIHDSVIQKDLTVDSIDVLEKDFTKNLTEYWSSQRKDAKVEPSKYLDLIEQQINNQWKKFRDFVGNNDRLQGKLKDLAARIACAEAVQSLLKNDRQGRRNDSVAFLVAVINNGSQLRFERSVYRVSRGLAYAASVESFKFEGLEKFNQKVVVIAFPGTIDSVLSQKLKRVVESFAQISYQLNRTQEQQNIRTLIQEYHDTKGLQELNEKELKRFLLRIKKADHLPLWMLYVRKQKLIYEALNKMEPRGSMIVADMYIVNGSIAQLNKSIQSLNPAPVLNEISIGTPPTMFNTNDYTAIPQEIVDTYGVPRYQQINPSIFTTVTFPFFFGVMFSDIAHGTILLAFGLYLIFTHGAKSKYSSLSGFYSMRYMMTMMGIFSMFCGLLYNDFMGMQLNLFGSCFSPTPQLSPKEHEGHGQVGTMGFEPHNQRCMYMFGLDPIWARAQNQLTYVNSLKMKISVILGVLHMILGILMKALNSLHFRKYLDFIFEFIPQIIFMTILFGYMDFLITFKWLKNVEDWNAGDNPQRWAPSIITTMMNIGLRMGKTSIITDGGSNMWGMRGHTSQDELQMKILIISMLCVFIMLLPKPIIEIMRASSHHGKKKAEQGSNDNVAIAQESGDEVTLTGDAGGHEHDASEIFVHQLIQTIQFALGAVSNTASYLRLWALSLAHQQLSKVFFTYTLQSGYTSDTVGGSLRAMIIGYYLLAFITFGIIICMDSMECFLHALRLHWVQFQNKFYKGDGYRFKELTIDRLIDDEQ